MADDAELDWGGFLAGDPFTGFYWQVRLIRLAAGLQPGAADPVARWAFPATVPGIFGAVGLTVLWMWGGVGQGPSAAIMEQFWEQLASSLERFGCKILTFGGSGGVWGTIWSPMGAQGAPGRQKVAKRDFEDPPRGSAERPKIAKIWQEGRPKGPKGGPGGLAMAGPILDAFLDRPWEAPESEN